ncbi:MAG: NarK/NasA family nitrate transporter [Burkholderia sp.]|nr:NarK/NasA family nitrate transporter [Burkholderia sp.]
MKNVMSSLKSGDWRALVACFLYFDTGFTVWVLYGPLAPFISKSISMTPAQQGLLVAVPVLSAAILRVTLGNLYQSAHGKRIALLGVLLSAVPTIVLPVLPFVPSYTLLLVLGVFLGVGGASFAVALPMAGSNYPPKVQGLVLGLAAAGNIGAVLDGFLFPQLATHYGWQVATGGALPLLAIAAITLYFWANDSGVKTGSVLRAFGGFAVTLVGLIVLVLLVEAGIFGSGKTGVLLCFVGMSSYVSLLLTNLYQLSKIDAGLFMALLAATGALVRPLGGLIADKVSGVRALTVLLATISLCDLVFAAVMPSLAGGIALLVCLYLAFGLGNGATFQLVPHRWAGRTGLMSGIVGAAGGIGGFYLPVVMGIAKESTGSYQMGFATFGALAACAFLAIVALRRPWMAWSMQSAGMHAHATE